MRNPHNPLGGALCHETWWEKDRMLYGNTARGLTVNVNSGFLVGFFFFPTIQLLALQYLNQQFLKWWRQLSSGAVWHSHGKGNRNSPAIALLTCSHSFQQTSLRETKNSELQPLM